MNITYFLQCCNVLCGLSVSIIFFHIISQKTRFWENVLNTKCDLVVSLRDLSKIILILRKTQRDINVHRSSCNAPLSFAKFWLNLPTVLRKLLKYHISLKSLQWEPSSFHADRQARWTDRQIDMTKLKVAIRNFFFHSPKNGIEDFSVFCELLFVSYVRN